MLYTKKLRNIADDIALHYAKFDSIAGRYVIDLADIPEFDLYNFSAVLMLEHEDYAAESTSMDNPWYESLMLPALRAHLASSTDKGLEDDFARAWRQGIFNYHRNTIIKLLNDSVDDYEGRDPWAA